MITLTPPVPNRNIPRSARSFYGHRRHHCAFTQRAVFQPRRANDPSRVVRGSAEDIEHVPWLWSKISAN